MRQLPDLAECPQRALLLVRQRDAAGIHAPGVGCKESGPSNQPRPSLRLRIDDISVIGDPRTLPPEGW